MTECLRFIRGKVTMSRMSILLPRIFSRPSLRSPSEASQSQVLLRLCHLHFVFKGFACFHGHVRLDEKNVLNSFQKKAISFFGHMPIPFLSTYSLQHIRKGNVRWSLPFSPSLSSTQSWFHRFSFRTRITSRHLGFPSSDLVHIGPTPRPTFAIKAQTHCRLVPPLRLNFTLHGTSLLL